MRSFFVLPVILSIMNLPKPRTDTASPSATVRLTSVHSLHSSVHSPDETRRCASSRETRHSALTMQSNLIEETVMSDSSNSLTGVKSVSAKSSVFTVSRATLTSSSESSGAIRAVQAMTQLLSDVTAISPSAERSTPRLSAAPSQSRCPSLTKPEPVTESEVTCSEGTIPPDSQSERKSDSRSGENRLPPVS